MNINVGDDLMTINVVEGKDKDGNNKYLKPFIVFIVLYVNEELCNIRTSEDNDWFKWYCINKEDLKGRCIKLKVEEV